MGNRARVRRKRVLGEDPSCRVCGTGVPSALVTGRNLCGVDAAIADEQTPVELHEPFGKSNDSYAEWTDLNRHRRFTELQRRWPARTLQNSEGLPSLRAAAGIRAAADKLEIESEDLRTYAALLEQEEHGDAKP